MTNQFETLMDEIASNTETPPVGQLRSKLPGLRRRRLRRSGAIGAMLVALAISYGLSLDFNKETVLSTETTTAAAATGSEVKSVASRLMDIRWTPVERTGVPESPSPDFVIEFLVFRESLLSLVSCESKFYSIQWESGGFSVNSETTAPGPVNLSACDHSASLGILDLLLVDGTFVDVNDADEGKYRLSTEEWSMVISSADS